MLDAYLWTLLNLGALFGIPFAILLAATAVNDAIVTVRRNRADARALASEHPYGPR